MISPTEARRYTRDKHSDRLFSAVQFDEIAAIAQDSFIVVYDGTAHYLSTSKASSKYS